MENAESSDGLNEWEEIQSPWPQTTNWVNNTDTLVITDDYLHHHSSVFPPSDHEGLPITPQHSPSSSLPSLSSSCSSSSSVSGEGHGLIPVSVTGEIGRRLKLQLGLLSSGIHRIVYAIRSYGVFRGGFLTVTGVAAAMVVSLLYVKVQRWRRRVLQENQDRLVLLVKEKDEKISQLLLQIAQMTEKLSTRSRVPVLRVG
ncbi:uncharacterized protein LOC132294827 [Cornus florida]|uniref:uncharacterized protein LOC132294827 n=1 Tax=Cornus florida TaxID=4283 RepID=UPI00289C1CFD|nr:uncharacterized protein LOC132294827 [Cornus florida]